RTLLASGGSDSAVRLWDPTTGQEEQVLTGHRGPVKALASVVVPDGRTLLASAGSDSTVLLWDLTNSEAVLWQALRPVQVAIVALCGLGDRLVVATQISTTILRLHPKPQL
ncbi:WD40 repeat domain-containing protein, partial [Nocardia sp. NPDC055321]